MSIEKILQDLTTAITAQTEALNRQADVMDKLMGIDLSANDKGCGGNCGKDEEKPVRKRKSTKKAAKKTAEPEAPATEDASGDNVVALAAEPKAEPVAEPAPVVETMSKEVAQERLRGIASVMTDTSALFELIKKYGGAQFSDLDPSVYEALLSDAEAELKRQQEAG